MSSLEQPKKAPSAYWIWLGEHRASLQKELPGKRGSEVSKLAGERWKALAAEEKAPFEKRAEDAKAEYQKALESFKSQGGVLAKRAGKKSGKGKESTKAKKSKDANAPKKPVGGAFGVFQATNRDDIKKSLPADHKITDVTKKCAELWKAVSVEDKLKYQKEFDGKMDTYKKQMKVYKESSIGEAEVQGTPPRKRATAKSTPEKKPAPKRQSKEFEPDADKSSTKRGRAEKATLKEPLLDGATLAEATKLGYEHELKNLAGRADVAAAGKTPSEMLEALKVSKGLVNPAKRALLGA